MEIEPVRFVLRPEHLHRIDGHFGRRGDLGKEPAIRPAEAQRAVRLPVDLVALLVDGAVVPAAERGEVRQGGGASMGPVPDVMALAEPHSAAREAAAAVAMVERPPDCRGNRPGPGIDLHDAAVPAVTHHDPARVAGQALGRSSWNARAVLEGRLAGRIGVRQDLGIDVDHDLVALPGVAGVEALVKGGLREQGEGVRLLLLHRRRSSWNVCGAGVSGRGSSLLVERLPGGSQRLHEQGAHLRGQPALDPHRAVAIRIHVQGPARVLQGFLARLGLPVHPAPAADDPRHVLGRAGPAHAEELLFGFGSRDARQLAELRERQLAAGESARQQGQRAQGARHPHVLAGGARGEARRARSARRRRRGSHCSSRRGHRTRG